MTNDIKPILEHISDNTIIYVFTDHDEHYYKLYDNLTEPMVIMTTCLSGHNRRNLTISSITPSNDLYQNIILRKIDSKIINPKNEIISPSTTRHIFNAYEWKNQNPEFIRCTCGSKAKLTEKTTNDKTMYQIYCTNCGNITKAAENREDAIKNWFYQNTSEECEDTPAHRQLRKWIILETNNGSYYHDRYYVGECKNNTDWKAMLNEAGYSPEEYPINATVVTPNATDTAMIFDDAMEDQNHHYLTSLFSEMCSYLKGNFKVTMTDFEIKSLLINTYNSFVTR